MDSNIEASFDISKCHKTTLTVVSARIFKGVNRAFEDLQAKG
jgi:hypothetical protein